VHFHGSLRGANAAANVRFWHAKCGFKSETMRLPFSTPPGLDGAEFSFPPSA
jgi:hypothetical protein